MNLEVSNVPFGFSEGFAFPVEASKLCIEILLESLVCIAIRPVVNREIAVPFSGISEKFSPDVAWGLVSFMNGIGLIWIQDPQAFSLREDKEALVDTFMKGIEP